MGYALARAARRHGTVTLVSGPTSLANPPSVKIVRVETAAEMARAVFSLRKKADVILQCAAVADYTPARVARHKIHKSARPTALKLTPTIDILGVLGEAKPRGQILVGFAAETRQLKRNALKKLRTKHLDFIVANPVGRKGSGFDSDMNEATLFSRSGYEVKFPRMPKIRLARKILQAVLART
jgi:phosphopantothenoylcysteine decarboxylase/phosphopantothenate--cysteine ligase